LLSAAKAANFGEYRNVSSNTRKLTHVPHMFSLEDLAQPLDNAEEATHLLRTGAVRLSCYRRISSHGRTCLHCIIRRRTAITAQTSSEGKRQSITYRAMMTKCCLLFTRSNAEAVVVARSSTTLKWEVWQRQQYRKSTANHYLTFLKRI